MPIGDSPAEVAEVVAAYNAWLLETETPLLFLCASPNALNPPEVADWRTERAKNIETAWCFGEGIDLLREDQPYAIPDWYRGPHQATGECRRSYGPS